MRRSFFSNRSFKFILGGLVFLFVLITIKDVYTQPPLPTYPYTLSAHGNTGYGVKRSATGFPTDYSRGNCAHCHEQHASIGGSEPDPVTGPQGYELFYDHWITKCDLFCYECHKLTGYVQTEVINNYPYSENYGGEPYTAYTTLNKHFCAAGSEYAICGSRHHLARIYTIIANDAYGWGYPADPDPCSACHNPHMAQRKGNKLHPPYTPDKSTISRSSEHKSNPLNLWGDESGERMSDYTPKYQAPYYGDTTGTRFEPSGNSTPSDGSDLPNYVSFCMDCHVNSQIDPERGNATVKAIVWGSTGDKHGGRLSGDVDCSGMWEGGNLRAPYSDANKEAGYNYVLSCTDCHEPHGGRNRLHLIRRFINGEAVTAGTDIVSPCVDSDADWKGICGRCHTGMHTFGGCTTCHTHGNAENCGVGEQRTF